MRDGIASVSSNDVLRGFVGSEAFLRKRLGSVMDTTDLLVGVDKDNIQRKRGVGHPKTPRFILLENKQHAFVGRQIAHVHQALAAFLVIISNGDTNSGNSILLRRKET